jgi:hypothetical protein
MAKDWRLGICTRWSYLAGVVLGILVLGFTFVLAYPFFWLKLEPLVSERGATVYWLVWLGNITIGFLPTILVLAIFRWWCRRRIREAKKRDLC